MTTEIATRDTNGAALVAPTPPEAVAAAIEQWVGGLAASVQGAEYIVDTPLCPDSLWPLPAGMTLSKIPGKNPKVMLPNEDRESFLARRRVAAYSLGGIVRYGLQLGIPPEVATQGIFVIGGRLSMDADQMVALVKSRGHRHRVLERTRERCVIEVQRLGEGPQEFTFTIDDAIQAGYVPGKGPNANLGTWPDGKAKTGGNEKYVSDPAGMLEARCNSTGLTAVFPDVLRGMVSYESMRDEQFTVHAQVEPDPVVTDRVTAAAILAAAPDSTPPPAAAVERIELPPPGRTRPPRADYVEGPFGTAHVASGTDVTDSRADLTSTVTATDSAQITAQQWKDVNSLFNRLGVTGEGQSKRRLTAIGRIVGREVTRGSELTAGEARIVCGTLEGVSVDGLADLLADLDAYTAPVESAPALPPLGEHTGDGQGEPGEWPDVAPQGADMAGEGQ